MKLGHLKILIAKERKQLLRDPSSIVFGLLLPIILLLIFGYGLSLDIKNIKLTIVSPVANELSRNVVSHFSASKYFIVTVVRSTAEGTEMVRTHRADGCIILPEDLGRRIASDDAKILVVVNATNATQARMVDTYVKGILLGTLGSTQSAIDIKSRMYFNDANESSYFMIPGVIVIIMSLIGTKLTSMLMAKEYEHGNMESMFATPMTAAELLTAKSVNNFILGMASLIISLLFARYLFGVPIRGNIFILSLGSGLYLLIALATGLLISSITKNQFVASQLSLVISFMPVFLLSGFLYEIPNMPVFVQYITLVIPARYYVDFLQTSFLVGNVWSNIVFNCAVMTLYAAVLMVLAVRKNPKTLEG